MVTYNFLLILWLMCLLLVAISYRHFVSHHRPRYRHILRGVNRLRSGINRPITSPSFGLDDILSPEDMALAEVRFQLLVKMFDTISEEEVRDVVNSLPTYLTVESTKIIKAIKMLRKHIPYVEPVYVFQQRAAGFELFMSVIQKSFDHDKRVRKLKRILSHSKYEDNITEFVRRAPQTLTPRYYDVLNDTIRTFDAELYIKPTDSIKIVEKFPSILSIDVKPGILRLKNTLGRLYNTSTIAPNKSLKYYTSPTALGGIIKAVPRVLVQDVSQRINVLQKQYPKWKLIDVVIGNPRVLTEKLPVLTDRYKSLQNKFVSVFDVDLLISSYPVALLRSPDSLYSAIDAVRTHLPSCDIMDIMKHSKIIECQIRRRVDKSRKTILHVNERVVISTNHTSDDSDGVVSQGGERVLISTNHTSDESDNFDGYHIENEKSFIDNGIVDNSDLHRINSLARNAFDPDDIWDVDSSYSANYPSIINSPIKLNITDANVGDYTFMTLNQNATLHLPAELSFLIDPILQDSTAETSDDMNGDDSVNVHSSHDSKISPSKPVELDLTRIIFGNIDTFLHTFPYFLTKLSAWNEEYGPEIAYIILTSKPNLMVKKPSAFRDIIKALYALVADTLSVEDSHSPVLIAADNKPMSRGHISDKLFVFLRASPAALKLKADEVQTRLHELSGIIECDIPTVKSCVVRSSHLLTEPLQRVALRKHLLSNIFASSIALKSMYTSESGLLIALPRLLCLPLAMLIRLYFLRKTGILEDCVAQIEELVCSKSYVFLPKSEEVSKCVLSSEYIRFLVSVHNRLADTETVEIPPTTEVAEMEKKLCGILNAFTHDAAKIDKALQY